MALIHGMPVAESYSLNLQNTDEGGRVVAQYDVPADQIKKVLDHVLFKAIPFDHSSAVLRLMMNLFYPTDDDYTGTQLGYYRQREWRLIKSGIAFHGHPMTRPLTQHERESLIEIDSPFWSRDIASPYGTGKRVDLAVIYQPIKGWDFLKLAKAIIVPEQGLERAKAIMGADAKVRSTP